MIKKAALALFGLVFAMALITPQKANAQVSLGVTVGPIVRPYAYVAPYPAYGYGYHGSNYYAPGYVYAPSYGYGYYGRGYGYGYRHDGDRYRGGYRGGREGYEHRGYARGYGHGGYGRR
jgi:hypothetical protein